MDPTPDEAKVRSGTLLPQYCLLSDDYKAYDKVEPSPILYNVT